MDILDRSSVVVYGLITARGGSKTIPHKNIVAIAGKPLINWTIQEALKSRYLNRVILSTDDQKIADVAHAAGCQVPFMRPDELSRDDSSSVDVVGHALRWLDQNEGELPDYIFILQPTSPLRSVNDIDGAIELAVNRNAPSVIGYCEALNHPYRTVTIEKGGSIKNFVQLPSRPNRRRDFPPAFVENGAIYLIHVDSFLGARKIEFSGTLPYIMPRERSIDIDTELDMKIAEFLLKQGGVPCT